MTFVTAVVLVFIGCETLVDGQGPTQVRDLSETELRVIESDNAFGLDLFRRLSEDEGPTNVFVSPLSVSMALGMALNGARGETRDAMREALHVQGLTEEEINRAYRSVIDLLTGLDPKVRFRIANSIWHRDDFAVEPEFLQMGRDYFDAEISAMDFTRSDAPDIINAWISAATDGMIDEMIDQIDPLVVMYLINAIYFKGDWTYQFDVEDTAERAFTSGDGRRIQVPMMHQQTSLPYVQMDDFAAVDLPYGDSLYTMTVLLPNEGRTVEDVIATLSAESWTDLTSSFQTRLVDLQMPRFRLSYDRELREILEAMGMGIAFAPGMADFSGINPLAELSISRVLHEAVVEVNEEGTEAAAATVVEIILTSGPSAIPFHLDRPFIFSIRERHTGSILFIGKANDVS